MDDFITQILGIKDDGIKVLGVKETPNTLTVTIERKIVRAQHIQPYRAQLNQPI